MLHKYEKGDSLSAWKQSFYNTVSIFGRNTKTVFLTVLVPLKVVASPACMRILSKLFQTPGRAGLQLLKVQQMQERSRHASGGQWIAVLSREQARGMVQSHEHISDAVFWQAEAKSSMHVCAVLHCSCAMLHLPSSGLVKWAAHPTAKVEGRPRLTFRHCSSAGIQALIVYCLEAACSHSSMAMQLKEL